MTGAILFKIPGVAVLADGGPFDHLPWRAFGASRPGAITAIMGLCLVRKGAESALTWRGSFCWRCRRLAVAVNSVAALYCVGVVGILLFWGRLGATRSWLAIVLMFCLFLGAWNVMGYSHSPDAARAMIKEHGTGSMVDAGRVVHGRPGIPDRGLPLDLTSP